MKKEYVRPAGRVLPLRLSEPVAASSGELGPGVAGGNSYGITYRWEGDSLFISNSTHIASSTGSATFDAFYDLVTSYVYDLGSVCRV